jgi:hypothetical protein
MARSASTNGATACPQAKIRIGLNLTASLKIFTVFLSIIHEIKNLGTQRSECARSVSGLFTRCLRFCDLQMIRLAKHK